MYSLQISPKRSLYVCGIILTLDNTFFIKQIGTAKGHIKSFNLNTAKEIESIKVGAPVAAIEFTGSGEIFFAGDKKVSNAMSL